MNPVVKLAMALVLGAAMAVPVSAQRAKPDPQKMDPARVEAMKELKASIKSFAQETILPQVRNWKTKLDAAMSPEDLAALNALRGRATALRGKFIEHATAMRSAWQSEDYVALKNQRDAMKELGAEKEAIGAELKPLAMKYLATLMEIGTEAKPVIGTWKQSGKDIFVAWQAKNKDVLGDSPMGACAKRDGPKGDCPKGDCPKGDCPKGACPHGQCPKGEKMGGEKMGGPMMHGMGLGMFGGRGGQKAMVAYFMLWDGGDIINEMENAISSPGEPGFMPNLD